jgi:hypothetical protein
VLASSSRCFVQEQVAGSPLAGHVAKVSDEARGAVAFPIEAHLASVST